MSEAWSRTGRILKADEAQRYTLGVVYEPGVKDSQGDWATAEEIEKACWEFNRNLGKPEKQVAKSVEALLEAILKALDEPGEVALDVTEIYEDIQKAAADLGLMHTKTDQGTGAIGEIVESYITRAEMTIGTEKVAAGTWLMGTVWSEDVWKAVQEGKITGLSMGGTGKRIPDPPAQQGGQASAGNP